MRHPWVCRHDRSRSVPGWLGRYLRLKRPEGLSVLHLEPAQFYSGDGSDPPRIADARCRLRLQVFRSARQGGSLRILWARHEISGSSPARWFGFGHGIAVQIRFLEV